MLTESYPIELFVSSEFHTLEINEIILETHLEVEDLKKLVVTCFYELGVYDVKPGMETYFHDQIITFLKFDPSIKNKVTDEIERMQKRKTKKSKHEI